MADPEPMPTNSGETDILNDLLEMLEANGAITDAVYRKLQIKSAIEIHRRLQKIERESVMGVYRRQPVKIVAFITVSFILLHEFATYVNLGVILTAALKLLGIPTP